jgi:hypothetical protein
VGVFMVVKSIISSPSSAGRERLSSCSYIWTCVSVVVFVGVCVCLTHRESTRLEGARLTDSLHIIILFKCVCVWDCVDVQVLGSLPTFVHR